MWRENGDRRVCVNQVQAGHAIALLKKIPQEANTLDLEVAVNQPLDAFAKIDYGAKPAVMLLHEKNIA